MINLASRSVSVPPGSAPGALLTPLRLAHRCGEPETGAGRNRGLEGGKFRFKKEEEERDKQRLMWPRGKPLGRKE